MGAGRESGVGPRSAYRTAIGSVLLVVALAAPAACGAPDRDTIDLASLGPQPTPEQALRAYAEVLAHGVREPDLALYTPATRRLLARSGVTGGQQASELRSLRPAIGSASVRRRGDLAVVRFGAGYPTVSPYFFERGANGWMLDLDTASRVIVFGRDNRWHLRSRRHRYAFAFDGE